MKREREHEPLYIVVTDETEAWEQQGYDVDVWRDDQDGRVESLSIVGLPKEKAIAYVEQLKKTFHVASVKWS